MMTPTGAPKRPPVALLIAAVLIVALGVLTAAGAVFAFQLENPVTKEAHDIRTLYRVTLTISFIVFFGVTSGIIWAIFRYRRTSDEIPVQVHGSSKLEFTWTIIPIIILVVLFIPSFTLMKDVKTPVAQADADVVVEVIGHQWWWEFRFPNENIDIARVPPDYQLKNIPLGDDNYQPPEIVLPVGKTILFKVSSADVVHSFFVPRFLFKIQAVPGNVNEFSVTIDKEGSFAGHCVQFCGLRHSDMLFIIDARSEADYQQWLNDTRQSEATPTPAAGAMTGK